MKGKLKTEKLLTFVNGYLMRLNFRWIVAIFIFIEFRETVTIGSTSLSANEVEDLVRQMGLNYQGHSYHLIDKYVPLNFHLL